MILADPAGLILPPPICGIPICLDKERPTSRDVPLPLSTHTAFPTMTPDTSVHGSNRPTIPDDVCEPNRAGCPTTRLPGTTGRGNSHPTIPDDDGGPSWDRAATTKLRAPTVGRCRSRPTIRGDAPEPSPAGCRTTTRHRARCDCRHSRPNLIRVLRTRRCSNAKPDNEHQDRRSRR